MHKFCPGALPRQSGSVFYQDRSKNTSIKRKNQIVFNHQQLQSSSVLGIKYLVKQLSVYKVCRNERKKNRFGNRCIYQGIEADESNVSAKVKEQPLRVQKQRRSRDRTQTWKTIKAVFTGDRYELISLMKPV